MILRSSRIVDPRQARQSLRVALRNFSSLDAASASSVSPTARPSATSSGLPPRLPMQLSPDILVDPPPPPNPESRLPSGLPRPVPLGQRASAASAQDFPTYWDEKKISPVGQSSETSLPPTGAAVVGGSAAGGPASASSSSGILGTSMPAEQTCLALPGHGWEIFGSNWEFSRKTQEKQIRAMKVRAGTGGVLSALGCCALAGSLPGVLSQFYFGWGSGLIIILPSVVLLPIIAGIFFGHAVSMYANIKGLSLAKRIMDVESVRIVPYYKENMLTERWTLDRSRRKYLPKEQIRSIAETYSITPGEDHADDVNPAVQSGSVGSDPTASVKEQLTENMGTPPPNDITSNEVHRAQKLLQDMGWLWVIMEGSNWKRQFRLTTTSTLANAVRKKDEGTVLSPGMQVVDGQIVKRETQDLTTIPGVTAADRRAGGSVVAEDNNIVNPGGVAPLLADHLAVLNFAVEGVRPASLSEPSSDDAILAGLNNIHPAALGKALGLRSWVQPTSTLHAAEQVSPAGPCNFVVVEHRMLMLLPPRPQQESSQAPPKREFQRVAGSPDLYVTQVLGSNDWDPAMRSKFLFIIGVSIFACGVASWLMQKRVLERLASIDIDAQYAQQSYWDDRYLHQTGTYFEWFGDCADITAELIQEEIGGPGGGPKTPKLLMLGAGNSILSEKLADEHLFTDILNVDYSKVVIEQMQSRELRRCGYRDEVGDKKRPMGWLEADVLNLRKHLDENIFDVVVDKSTLDAVDCGHAENAELMLSETDRVMKEGGVFVSYCGTAAGKKLIDFCGRVGWDWRMVDGRSRFGDYFKAVGQAELGVASLGLSGENTYVPKIFVCRKRGKAARGQPRVE